MQRFKKVLMGVAALGALAFGGAQIADATGGGSDAKTDDVDHVITGSKADAASAAAVKAVGGGTAQSVESSDEDGGTYEVKVDESGKITEVTLDDSYGVVSQKADDDQNESGDEGDDEGPDGDGDGENPNE